MPARGLLGHGLEPGQRAPAPGGGGRAPAGPWEAGARGQGPQVLLTGALKILQRVWAAGGGQCGKYLKESMPAGRTCWRRGGEIRRRAPLRTRPSGPSRVAMSAATIDRYLAPAGARAVRGRSTAKGRSRLARLHQDPQGRRARWRPSPGSSRPVTVAHCGPVLKGEFARTVEHDPMCSRGGPSPARSAGVADKAHHLGPRRRRGRDPAGPVPGTGSRGRLGVHRPRRGAAGREPGASAPARSRPHGKNDQATIKTREATMRCAATPCYRHGRRRRTPGAGPPAGAGQHQAQLTRPPPANHRVGRRQGRQAQAPTGPPRTPGPAAGRRRPDRRTPRRPN